MADESVRHAQVVNPAHQIHHLTRHMTKAVALNVDTKMRHRTLSSISKAERTNSEDTTHEDTDTQHRQSNSSSSSSSDAASSNESSPNNSPTSLVSTMPLPQDGRGGGASTPKVSPPQAILRSPPPRQPTASPEALLMPGKAFLESFYLFLKQHAKSLRVRNPRLQVLLNPPCLHYLEGCFHAMLEASWNPDSGAVLQWQARRDVSSKDVSSSVPSSAQGMSKTNRMLKLAGFVLNVIDVRIDALPDTIMPLPSQCNLAIFSSLLYLTVSGVARPDLVNLESLRKQLVELHISKSSIAAPRLVLGETQPWPALKSLSLIDCGLLKLDPSLALAPNVHTLNVSGNDLQTLSHLENCVHLAVVNVSRNQLASVAGAHRYLTNVATLDVSYNPLTSTAGLEKMFGLHALDLSHTELPTTGEIAFLVSLPLLRELHVVGNPFFDVPYRTRVLELLGRGVVLDETPWTSDELGLFDRLHHPTIDTLHSLTTSSSTDEGITHDQDLDDKGGPFQDLGHRVVTLLSLAVDEGVTRSTALCGLLLLAHALALAIWPRDAWSDMRDTFMAWTVGSIAAVVAVVAIPVYGIVWLAQSSAKHSRAAARRPLSPRMTKQLSFNADHDAFDDGDLPAASLDVLSSSLEVLVEWATEMPLHDFLTMASEATKLLRFLGPMGSFALKTWVRDEAMLTRVWTERHRRDSDVSMQQLVRDDDARHDKQSFTRTVLRMVPVLMYLRNLCLEMEKSADATLQACASTAYVNSIAKQHKHAWLVQKAVLSAIQLSPVTRQELLLMWDVEDLEQDAEFKEQRLHACGRMLDMVVVQLAKLRDVYNIKE
ncbi:Aste57867_21327 [Aphanomyces stellatus]|uniref:Aste57867_21327 protein n=1 Tax=Aphanomyces stellatus TaxID=120398 RepID=A0A485LH66_9STRA|nr:hypothetical protein As57867_021258 [Aphanomyces stellatus]VFT97999.1 Aste57867_21327 [Aphanomyces stellatus]